MCRVLIMLSFLILGVPPAAPDRSAPTPPCRLLRWRFQSVDEAREVAFNRYVCRCIDEEKFRRLMKSNPKMAKRQMPTVNDRLEFRPRLSKEQEKLAKKEAKAKKNLEERVD